MKTFSNIKRNIDVNKFKMRVFLVELFLDPRQPLSLNFHWFMTRRTMQKSGVIKKTMDSILNCESHHLRKYLHNYLRFNLIKKSITAKQGSIEPVKGSETDNVGYDIFFKMVPLTISMP